MLLSVIIWSNVSYFDFYQCVKECSTAELQNLLQKSFSNASVQLLAVNITAQEIKDTLFSLKDDKAPGPDGYTIKFFREAWSTVASDSVSAFMSFFETG